MRASLFAVLVALVSPAFLVLGFSPPAEAAPSVVECSPPTLNLDVRGPRIACTTVMLATPNPRGIDPSLVNLVVFDSGVLLARIPTTTPCDPCVSGNPHDGVRVKFHFDRQETSNWVRIAMPLAGADRGFHCLPETEDEVLVAFEMGDPRFPFIFQRVWDGCDIVGSAGR